MNPCSSRALSSASSSTISNLMLPQKLKDARGDSWQIEICGSPKTGGERPACPEPCPQLAKSDPSSPNAGLLACWPAGLSQEHLTGQQGHALQNRQARAGHGLEGSIPSPLRRLSCGYVRGGASDVDGHRLQAHGESHRA